MSFVTENLAGHPGLVRGAYEAAGAVFNGRHAGDEYRIRCPFHADTDESPNLDVNFQKATFLCRACGVGGDAVQFYAKLKGISTEEAIAALREKLGLPTNGNGQRGAAEPTVVKTTPFEICDTTGNLVAIHYRHDLSDGNKRFSWERNGQRNLGGLPVGDLPLYGAELIGTWEPGSTVIVTEGEGKAVVLRAHGYQQAVATVTGARATPAPTVFEPLKGFDVVLSPDFDEVGRQHMARNAATCRSLGMTPRILTGWGEKEPGDDLADFFARGGTAEHLDRLLADAPEYVPLSAQPTTTATSQDQASPAIRMRYMSEIEAQRVEWLWKPRIPIGFLTMLDGDPEKAKSTLLLWVISRGSRGNAFPDGQVPDAPFRSVILSAEDPAETVLRPRFDAFGGDPTMVAVVDSIRRKDNGASQLISLKDDLPILVERIRQVRPALVTVDPITAYLGTADSFKDSIVRDALGPLVDMAASEKFALVVVRHLNKNVNYTDVLYRGGGSIGFIAAARGGLMAVVDPDDEEGKRLLLAHYKNNLASKGTTLAYRVVASERDPDLPAIEWLGEDPRSARQLHAAGQSSSEAKSAKSDARNFLEDLLADGELPMSDVFAAARKDGHSPATLRRAAKDLNVVKRKTGFAPSVWVWGLP